ncbi:MAG TPA: aspartate aminotransferase family protein [Chloroflexota bacterium]|nr:aspartate aminotransferase family protein [Chloroflexota bacterium]
MSAERTQTIDMTEVSEPRSEPSYAESISLYDEARAFLAGGVSSNFRLGGQPAPLFFERAAGAWLYDVDGNRYVDYALGMGPNILGHAPAGVTAAVAASLSQGQLFAGQHRAELELARRLRQLVPCAELVRFGLSGSEMVQAALRLARAATGRPLVVKFEGHYHGWFDTILVSVHPPLDQAGPPERPTRHLPSAGQSHAAAQDVAVLPWNDLQAVARLLESRGGETAALIMEPILCNTGVILPRPGYLEGVRALCDRHGVVLIFDEVITGFRAGLGGAQGRLGVTPDLAVFAKAMGGGFPIAALAGRRALMELTGNGSVLHGGTYNSNTVSVAAALAVIDELAAEGGQVYRAMEAQGLRLMEGLRELAGRAGVPLLVQGLGTVFNTAFGNTGADQPEVSDYRSYQQTDLHRQRVFLRALQDHGVRVTARGTWFLSAAHGEAEIETTLAATGRAMRQVT